PRCARVRRTSPAARNQRALSGTVSATGTTPSRTYRFTSDSRPRHLADEPDAERGRDAEDPASEEAMGHRCLHRPRLIDPSRRPGIADHEAQQGQAANAEDETVAGARAVRFSRQPPYVVASRPLVSWRVRRCAIAATVARCRGLCTAIRAALDTSRAGTGTVIAIRIH